MQLKPILNNRSVPEQTKGSAFIAEVRIQVTYDLYIWSCMQPPQFKLIEQDFMLSGWEAHQIPWFMGCEDILKNINFNDGNRYLTGLQPSLIVFIYLLFNGVAT